MKEQPKNIALRLIHQTGNKEFAMHVCLQMINEEKDWLQFFHQSENKNVKAASDKISFWEGVKSEVEKYSQSLL